MEQHHSPDVSFKIVVADDHAIVREAVVQTLQSLKNVSTIFEADNGLKAIALVKKHKPDLLVLDSAMPLARGIEVYFEARRWSPQSRIVLLTGFTSLGLLSDWLEAGVDAILLKSSETDELKLAFNTVLNGARYIAQEVLLKLEQHSTGIDLSPREREVLSLIASGNANSDIADRLNISQKTVEKHRASLMKKLDVHSVAELMIFALREGLLDDYHHS